MVKDIDFNDFNIKDNVSLTIRQNPESLLKEQCEKRTKDSEIQLREIKKIDSNTYRFRYDIVEYKPRRQWVNWVDNNAGKGVMH